MLHEFLTSNRTELITRCKSNAAKRLAPSEHFAAFEHGIPLFLQQVVVALRLQKNPSDLGPTPVVTEISRAAGRHGADLLLQGYSVEQVVREYGDVWQVVTEFASEQDESISADEFHLFNRCLDDAIAEAVTFFGLARQDDQAETWDQSLTVYSDEQQRLVGMALQACAALKTGRVGLGGSTGTLLIQSLEELRSLAARRLPETLPGYESSSPVG